MTIQLTDIFVHPAGHNANSGTREHPVATLTRARDLAREHRTAGRADITIRVSEGTYYLAETLALTAEDAHLALVGEGNAIISGGIRLALHWTPWRDGILRAQTPPGLTIDQLFVNGRLQHMARYPNYDLAINPFGGYTADACSVERAARWANPAGGYLHALHAAEWGGFHYRITGKDADGAVLLEGGWQNNRPMGRHPDYQFVENVFEELDAPGEWFHDAETYTLYYYPEPDVDPQCAVVEAAGLRQLIALCGTSANPVHGVRLRGFTFCHTARTFMDSREPLLRSDWTIYRGGAIHCAGTNDCRIDDCTFDTVGGNALFVDGYNRNLAVHACHFHDLGASAVVFAGDPRAVRNPLFCTEQYQSVDDIDRMPGPLTDDYPVECMVEDCLIERIGTVEKQTAGVAIAMSRRITVRHCTICQTPRAGISINDGCWGGHLIEYCDVFDTVLETGDHGAFNAWGRDRYWQLAGAKPDQLAALSLLDAVEPTVIRFNRWRCDHGWDIDLDDGASHYVIEGNLLLCGGLKLREGFHRRVHHNITIGNTFHPHAWYADSGDIVTQNLWMGAYRPAAMPDDLPHWGHTIDHNFFAAPDDTRARYLGKGCDRHSHSGDPDFVDPAMGDYRLSEISPAHTLGIVNILLDRYGIQFSVPRQRHYLDAYAETDEP